MWLICLVQIKIVDDNINSDWIGSIQPQTHPKKGPQYLLSGQVSITSIKVFWRQRCLKL